MMATPLVFDIELTRLQGSIDPRSSPRLGRDAGVESNDGAGARVYG